MTTDRGDIVGKTTTATLTVVGILILLFCVLPMFLCVGCGALGSMQR